MLKTTAIVLLVVSALAVAVPVYAAVTTCDPHACCKPVKTKIEAAKAGCCGPAACVAPATADKPNRDYDTVSRVSIARVVPETVDVVVAPARPVFDTAVAAPPPKSRTRLAQLATLLI